MKILLLTDLHFGVKSDSPIFHEYQKLFFDDILFPYLDTHSIDTMIILGDVFDRRKYTNHQTIEHCKKNFFDVLEIRNIQIHNILGNHDVTFKNTNRLNSPNLLLREYKNITHYDIPKDVRFDGCDVLMMPWINSENMEACFNAIDNSKSHICMGHFELSHETLKRSFKFSNGVTLKQLNKFEVVFSGHYHQRIEKGNFKYLGVPYHQTWEDLDQTKGFHIFDTSTRELDFIENPHKIYKRIEWNDDGTKDMKKLLAGVDKHGHLFEKKYIEIVVKAKANPYVLDRFVESIEQHNPYNVKIKDATIHISHTNEEGVVEIEDTLTTILRYIENVDNLENKDALLDLFKSLYIKASTQQD